MVILHEVTKLECVGHVQKRLGSRLRSLKKRTGQARLADGKCIGGRGRLTDKTIDSLQVYYGKAIRENTHDITETKKAVMAIWHHKKSTDYEPDHDLCPPGEKSWFGYKGSGQGHIRLYPSTSTSSSCSRCNPVSI